jgi:hypothetical protein
MLWRNEEYATGLGNDIKLDGVVCVVDAMFGMKVSYTLIEYFSPVLMDFC